MKKFLLIASFGLSGAVYADGLYADANIGFNTTQSYTGALNLNAGYMFSNYVGTEVGYTGGNGNNLWDIAAKGVLPFPLIDIYGKIGAAYQNNFSATSPALLYGAGVSFPIFPMLRLNVEDYAVSGNITQNFVMAGLQFHF